VTVFCALSTRGADKSLARPGRKQATATKLYLLQATQKNSEGCPSNQVSAAAMTSASDEKWRPFSCFFSRAGLRTYQHPCNVQKLRTVARTTQRYAACTAWAREKQGLFCVTADVNTHRNVVLCFIWGCDRTVSNFPDVKSGRKLCLVAG